MSWRNNVSEVPLDVRMPMHVDIPRLREGKVGGFFWYAFSLLYRLYSHNSRQVCIRGLCREFGRGEGLFDRHMESPVGSSVWSYC